MIGRLWIGLQPMVTARKAIKEALIRDAEYTFFLDDRNEVYSKPFSDR